MTYSSPCLRSTARGQRGASGLDSRPRNRRTRHLETGQFHGTYDSITSSVFGTIYLHTNKFYVEDPTVAKDSNGDTNAIALEVETQFTFYPAR